MAVYPGAVVVFSTKQNLVDIVDAADPNTIQDEVVAVQATVGATPGVSVNPLASSYVNASTSYSTLSARVANVEHGVVADAHAQYVHKSGGDIIAPASNVVGLSVKAPTTTTANVFQVTDNGGSPVAYVDSAGVFRLTGGAVPTTTGNAGTTVTSLSAGQAAAAGTSTDYSRKDHSHGLPPSDGAAGTASFRTLGAAATQAAPGNHTHTSLDLTGLTETRSTVSATGAATSLDLSTGLYFVVNLSANTTLSFTNPPASGKVASITILATQDATGGRTIAWPTGTKWTGGTQPVQSTAANSVSVYSLFTEDGGTTYYAFLSGKAMA